MSKGLKVALILISVTLLLCGVSVGGVVLWFNANKDTLKADGDRVKREAEEFARGNDANACVDEGLRRLEKDRGLISMALHNVFVEHCLERAAQPTGFCEQVPAKGQIIDGATWAVGECERRGHAGDQDCARMLQVVQRACSKKK